MRSLRDFSSSTREVAEAVVKVRTELLPACILKGKIIY